MDLFFSSFFFHVLFRESEQTKQTNKKRKHTNETDRKNIQIVEINVGRMVTSNHSSSKLRKLIGTSADDIRELVRSEKSLHCIEGLTPLGVISHIHRNNLFS